MPATPAWPPKSAPRLFVPQGLSLGASVVIEGGQAHYLARVMRIAPGDAVVLCDDQTGEWAARVTEAGKREVQVTCEVLLRPREQVPDFTLCAALLKKDRFDLVLEKACELGVRRIQPVLTGCPSARASRRWHACRCRASQCRVPACCAPNVMCQP